MHGNAYQPLVLLAVALLLCTGLAGTAVGATYYVSPSGNDQNPGTQSAPWRTVQKAANAMVGGDTAVVMDGTYSEIVNTVRSGAAGSRITFRGSGRAVIKSFNIRHNYITVDRFEMTAANQTYMLEITGSYCQLLNNTIHDTGATAAIVWMSSNSTTGCLIKGNRYYSSTGPGRDLAVIVIAGTDNIAENNEIGPAKDIDAFRIWGERNIIRNNYIHDATFSAGSGAHMDVFQTFGVGGNGQVIARNIVFEKNRIINFAGELCMTEHNGSSAGMRDWDIRNNLFVNVPQHANIGIPNMRWYNNTFYNVGASNRLVFSGSNNLPKGEATGAKIYNNVIITATNVVDYRHVMGVSGSGVAFDYNHVANIDGFAPLANFNEAHGINGRNPLFVSVPSDFNLQAGSPGIDSALTMTSFRDDFQSKLRPQGAAWDIGAFESGAGTGASLPAPTNFRTMMQ
jgi:hypothetical protein